MSDATADPYGDGLSDIRWRTENMTARRAADGRIYDDLARAVEDRRILLEIIDEVATTIGRGRMGTEWVDPDVLLTLLKGKP